MATIPDTTTPDSTTPDIGSETHGNGPAAVSHTSYDRDLLREQLTRLRQTAATRSQLEREITTEYETETIAANREADAAIAAVEKKHARESEATRREHTEVIAKADAEATAERNKLDAQQKNYATTYSATGKNRTRNSRKTHGSRRIRPRRSSRRSGRSRL